MALSLQVGQAKVLGGPSKLHRRGYFISLARAKDASNAAVLERWQCDIEAAFDGSVLGIDNAVPDH